MKVQLTFTGCVRSSFNVQLLDSNILRAYLRSLELEVGM